MVNKNPILKFVFKSHYSFHIFMYLKNILIDNEKDSYYGKDNLQALQIKLMRQAIERYLNHKIIKAINF